MVDKKITYSIKDTLNDSIKVSIKITTIGFPVEEKLEYHNAGKWHEDISNISRVYNNTKIQDSWSDFQSRLLSFLNDGNMRVLLDIMMNDDEYISSKYNLHVIVEDSIIVDNYKE